jgi:FkbM family methyltransferase
MSVADVGAGQGEMTVALAAEIGPSGRIYATDIDPEALEQIRTRVAAAELRNVTILQARARDTGLPTSCCDAVVLRREAETELLEICGRRYLPVRNNLASDSTGIAVHADGAGDCLQPA